MRLQVDVKIIVKDANDSFNWNFQEIDVLCRVKAFTLYAA